MDVGTALKRTADSRPSEPPATRFLVILNRQKPTSGGLLSTLHQVIGQLHRAEREGMTPVVFLTHTWLYWREEGYNGSLNGWEYYFEPVSPYAITDVVHASVEHLSRCNVYDFDNARIEVNDNPRHVYDPSRRGHVAVPPGSIVTNRWPTFHAGTSRFIEKHRVEMHRIVGKYIRIKPGILAKANAYAARYFAGRKMVGVHVRGPERHGEIGRRRGLAGADDGCYMRLVDRYLRSHPDAGVFLATDRERTLTHFREHYGARCFCCDSRRSAGDGSPHIEHSGPEVGEEMLIETILLARTDFLVHGISNVPFAVLCMNKDLPHADVYDAFARKLRTRFLVGKLLRVGADRQG